jgi:O-antigen ligase
MPARQALLCVLCSLPILFAAGYGLYSNADGILQTIGKDPNFSERTIIWHAAAASLAQHPVLGYGYAAFWQGLAGPSLSIVLAAGWELQQAQNGYLDLGLQIGACGLALLFALLVQAAINFTRCFKGSSNAPYVRWCAVVVMCSLLYNLGETSFLMQHLDWLLLLLACVGLQKEARAFRQRFKDTQVI